MKISLFFLSFCFFFQFTFAQYDKKEKIKYCFQSHYSKTSKQQLHSFLDSYETLLTIDKRGKFRCIDCEDYRSHYDTSQLEIPDSIHGLFKVTNIVKKKNNYQKKGKKIHRKTLFLIDLEYCDEQFNQCPKYIRLISIDTSRINNNKIRIGKKYEMTIYSFFERDKFSPIMKDGSKVYMIRKKDEIKSCYMYENIWIVYVDISSYNMFETPNLKGLYYIKP